jgi:hypothetical protein
LLRIGKLYGIVKCNMLTFPDDLDALSKKLGYKTTAAMMTKAGVSGAHLWHVRNWTRGFNEAAAQHIADQLNLSGDDRERFLTSAAIHYLLSSSGLKERGATILREGIARLIDDNKAMRAELDEMRKLLKESGFIP